MKKAAFVMLCYLLVISNVGMAQESLSNTIVAFEKQSKQNVKLYGFTQTRTLSETYLTFYEVNNGKFDLRFSEYSGGSISQSDFQKLVFVSQDLAISYLSAGNTSLSSGKALLALDGYIIEVFLPSATLAEMGNVENFTIKQRDNYIWTVYSKNAIDDSKKTFTQLSGKVKAALETNMKLVYDEYAKQIVKLQKAATYNASVEDVAKKANEATIAILSASAANQANTKSIAIKNNEETALLEKEKKERDAKTRAENLAFIEPFGKEVLTFEENFKEWSYGGKPSLIYYTGLMGFLGGKGRKDLIKNHELKQLRTVSVNDKPQPIFEYNDILGVESDIWIDENNATSMKYISRAIDADAKESKSTIYASLRGYKKSYFYGYDICAANITHSKEQCDPNKKTPLYDYDGVAFWIKGNLIILHQSGSAAEPFAYVYAYPGAMPLELNEKFVYKLWIYVNGVLIPKQTKDGNN